ncbi:MAG: hypothetical protein PVF47_19895 [Anaerolineae bacterium]
MTRGEKVHQASSPANPGSRGGVRFPLPAQGLAQARRPWSRIAALLPAAWRRQVVIQGQRYWLPG